ncbi:MAG: ATP-binding protein [Candidatus Rokuibacteriota bacterium]
MSRHEETFPARLEAFPRIAAFVEGVCAGAGVPRADCLRLTLVVEELFVNTVVRGHGGDSDAPVHLALDLQPGRIRVSYADRGPAFDPFARPPECGDVDERPVGGLGLILVRRLSSDFEYSRAEGGNRIDLVIACR